MLKAILDRHVLLILMGVFAVLGIVSKCIACITLKRLVRAAGSMNKSAHPLIRLVRAKYEHACMLNDKVQNVGVFVDKYLYEYKILGLRLYRWRRMENVMAGLCLITGAAAAFLTYSVYGMSDAVLKMGAGGAALAILLYLFHLTSDENYMLEAVKTYMVDYLENVCARRYEKNQQKEKKEIKGLAVREEPENAAEDRALAAKVEKLGTAGIEEDVQKLQKSEPKKEEGADDASGTTKKEIPAEVPLEIPEPGQDLERLPKPEISAASSKKSREEKKEQKQVSKEVLIREILEEFLA